MANPSPEQCMRRAISLSRQGLPAPNPHVGCVVVAKGEVVGEGFHRYAGGLHAEAAALAAAGPRARGAEVFCTLEPCNHQGRQPPCTRALISAGVGKVWFACRDPNPRVAGGGAQALRESGIAVEAGLLEEEAAEANKPWLMAMRRRRPFVVLKAAMTLDGRIALPNGQSRWITGEKARRQARRLRAELGAVLVGSGTVLKDNPQLTARIRGLPNEPMRIVLDPDGAIPETAAVFRESGRALRVVSIGKTESEGLALPLKNGQFEVKELLSNLFEMGVAGILVEGGALTLSSFLKSGMVDRLDLFIGNAAFGAGPSWSSFEPPESPAEAKRWSLAHIRRLENDVWIRYEAMT